MSGAAAIKMSLIVLKLQTAIGVSSLFTCSNHFRVNQIKKPSFNIQNSRGMRDAKHPFYVISAIEILTNGKGFFKGRRKPIRSRNTLD
jgi:hypothetical protein